MDPDADPSEGQRNNSEGEGITLLLTAYGAIESQLAHRERALITTRRGADRTRSGVSLRRPTPRRITRMLN